MTIALLGMALTGLVASAGAATLEDVENSFFPYRNGVPTFEGLKEGLVINTANVDKFKPIIDPETFKYIKDGWFEMHVGKTTSFDLHPNYIKATRDGLGKVSLGAEVGQINGFVAGRPFPEEIDINDPRAGEKHAWNYTSTGITGGIMRPFIPSTGNIGTLPRKNWNGPLNSISIF